MDCSMRMAMEMRMEMTEQAAEQEILRMLRRKPRDLGLPCMRIANDGTKVVVDNSRLTSSRLAQGSTWIEVYHQIEALIAKYA